MDESKVTKLIEWTSDLKSAFHEQLQPSHLRLSHWSSRTLLRTSMYDSDTESEPESDLKKWDAAEFALQLPHTASEDSDHDLVGRVADAITTLRSIPVQEVLKVLVLGLRLIV